MVQNSGFRGKMDFSSNFLSLFPQIFNFQVFAASDTEEKLDKLRATGVQRTINWKKEDMPAVCSGNTNFVEIRAI